MREGEPDPGSLAAFLERVSLVADADQLPDSDDGVVTMMTLHTAKGLEFPVVFVTGWEDGQFPHMRALGDPAELSEERRLAYVGITRARQRLYLTRAIIRSAWGQPIQNPASRFIQEIPEDLINWRREDPGTGGGFGSGRPGYGSGSRYGSQGGQGYGGGQNYGEGPARPRRLPVSVPRVAATTFWSSPRVTASATTSTVWAPCWKPRAPDPPRRSPSTSVVRARCG
ncbi:hypothetical protein GCM10020255_100120 [Rhodococcus baikonurensis]